MSCLADYDCCALVVACLDLASDSSAIGESWSTSGTDGADAAGSLKARDVEAVSGGFV